MAGRSPLYVNDGDYSGGFTQLNHGSRYLPVGTVDRGWSGRELAR